MSTPLDQFRQKLVSKIVWASSDKVAERYVCAALKGLEKKKINGYLIARFMDKTVSQLASLPSAKLKYDQWNNVRKATLLIQGIRSNALYTTA